MNRPVAGLLILLCTGSAGCRRQAGKVSGTQTPTVARVVPARDAVAIRFDRPSRASLGTAPLTEIPDRLADIYRLQPDRRFLLAVAEIHRFFDGKASREIRLSFSGGRWSISSDNEPVGELPEFAGYLDSTGVLHQWARRLSEKHPASLGKTPNTADWPAIEKRVAEFAVPSLIAALTQLDELWRSGSHDPRLASLGARAYVRLCLQTLDHLEMADSLGARAWAFAALSSVAGSESDVAEQTLVARLLGYTREDRQIARSLPAGHIVRDFIDGNPEAFLKRIEMKDDPFARYLGLLTVAQKGHKAQGYWGNPEIWGEWFQSHYTSQTLTLPILRTALAVDAFGSNPMVSDAILHEVFLELSDRSVPPEERSIARDLNNPALQMFMDWVRSTLQVKPRGLLRQFETRLASRRPTAGGPFWDATSFEAVYRGYFYSALFTLARHYTEALASAPASQRFTEYLEDAPEGPAAQFSRWYGDHVAARYGEGPDPKRLIEDFTILNRLGLPALTRLYGDLGPHMEAISTATADVIQPYVKRLDSRLSHQLAFSGPAFFPLQDLKLTEQLCRNLLAALPPSSLGDLTTCVLTLGRERDLLALIDRPDIDFTARTNALWFAAARSVLPASTVRAQFRKLLAESSYDRAVVRPYLLYLDGKEDDAESRWLVELFLSRLKPSDGLLYSMYRGRLARVMNRQGHPKEAWAVIEPEIRSGQGGVLAWAAEILWSLGRRDDAISMAKGLMERYPTDETARATVADILWRADRFSEAALVLDWPAATQLTWRDTFALTFERSFRKREKREAIGAFEAMMGQRISPFYLQFFPDAVASSRPDLAFELASRLKEKRGILPVVGSLFRAYRHLKKSKGKEVAVRWLKESIPQKMREPGRVIFFDGQDFDLLWSVVEPPAGGELSSFTWLLRTAGAAYRGLDRDAHRQELLSRYANRLPSDFHHTMGRFLLGLEDRSSVFPLAATPEQRTETAYFLGVRALIDRHPREAVDWFRTVIEIDTEPSWEVVTLARFALTRFSERYRPLEEKQEIW